MSLNTLQAVEQADPPCSNLRSPAELPALLPADRFRDASRAIADLRRGEPVVLREGDRTLAFAVVETVDAPRLARLREWARGEAMLVGPVGLGDSLGEPAFAAAALPRGITLTGLRRAAEPLRPSAATGVPVPLPGGAGGAVILTKLARLLPTLVAAPLKQAGIERALESGAIIVDSADVLALRTASGPIERVGEARIPLEDAADARLVAFRDPATGTEHLAVVIGRPDRTGPDAPAPLVRLHSECFTGDVLGSLRCDCGPQLRDALRRMAAEGSGIVLYLAQEGRGIGLLNKLRSYVLQDGGLDTVDANAALGFSADERDFALAAAMLRELGVMRVRLLTNNPAKVATLTARGIAVERAALLVAANGVNDDYLATKAARFGHLLS